VVVYTVETPVGSGYVRREDGSEEGAEVMPVVVVLRYCVVVIVVVAAAFVPEIKMAADSKPIRCACRIFG